MASKDKIIKELKEALIKEKLKSIPKETIVTVASALDTYGLLNFAGDSNLDNLKIRHAIKQALKAHKEIGGAYEDVFNSVERQLHDIEVHTTVRDAIHVGLENLGLREQLY